MSGQGGNIKKKLYFVNTLNKYFHIEDSLYVPTNDFSKLEKIVSFPIKQNKRPLAGQEQGLYELTSFLPGKDLNLKNKYISKNNFPYGAITKVYFAKTFSYNINNILYRKFIGTVEDSNNKKYVIVLSLNTKDFNGTWIDNVFKFYSLLTDSGAPINNLDNYYLFSLNEDPSNQNILIATCILKYNDNGNVSTYIGHFKIKKIDFDEEFKAVQNSYFSTEISDTIPLDSKLFTISGNNEIYTLFDTFYVKYNLSTNAIQKIDHLSPYVLLPKDFNCINLFSENNKVYFTCKTNKAVAIYNLSDDTPLDIGTIPSGSGLIVSCKYHNNFLYYLTYDYAGGVPSGNKPFIIGLSLKRYGEIFTNSARYYVGKKITEFSYINNIYTDFEIIDNFIYVKYFSDEYEYEKKFNGEEASKDLHIIIKEYYLNNLEESDMFISVKKYTQTLLNYSSIDKPTLKNTITKYKSENNTVYISDTNIEYFINAGEFEIDEELNYEGIIPEYVKINAVENVIYHDTKNNISYKQEDSKFITIGKGNENYLSSTNNETCWENDSCPITYGIKSTNESGSYSTSIGHCTVAGEYSISIGRCTISCGSNLISIGGVSYTGEKSIIINSNSCCGVINIPYGSNNIILSNRDDDNSLSISCDNIVLIGKNNYINNNNLQLENSIIISPKYSNILDSSSIILGSCICSCSSCLISIGQNLQNLCDCLSTIIGFLHNSISSCCITSIGVCNSFYNANSSLSIGTRNNISNSRRSISIGNYVDLMSSSDCSISIGNDLTLISPNLIVIGCGDTVNGQNSIVIGNNIYNNTNNSIGIGNQFSINCGCCNIILSSCITHGLVTGKNHILIGNNLDFKNPYNNSYNRIAIGTDLISNGCDNIVIGSGSTVCGLNSIAQGKEAFAAGSCSITIGYYSCSTSSSISIGNYINNLASSYSVFIGNCIQMLGNYHCHNINIGYNISSNISETISIGTDIVNNKFRSIALSTGTKIKNANELRRISGVEYLINKTYIYSTGSIGIHGSVSTSSGWRDLIPHFNDNINLLFENSNDGMISFIIKIICINETDIINSVAFIIEGAAVINQEDPYSDRVIILGTPEIKKFGNNDLEARVIGDYTEPILHVQVKNNSLINSYFLGGVVYFLDSEGKVIT